MDPDECGAAYNEQDLTADSALATDATYSVDLDALSLGTNFKATPLMQ